MKKYFKNDKEITVQRIKEQYQKKRWSTSCRDVDYEEKQFRRLVGYCKQSDTYLDWIQKKKAQKQKVSQLKGDVSEIECNKVEIVLKNSEGQYNDVLKKVKDSLWEAERGYNKLEQNAPPSKYDLLKNIYEDIKKAKTIAEQEWRDYMKRQQENCRCGRGSYCQC